MAFEDRLQQVYPSEVTAHSYSEAIDNAWDRVVSAPHDQKVNECKRYEESVLNMRKFFDTGEPDIDLTKKDLSLYQLYKNEESKAHIARPLSLGPLSREMATNDEFISFGHRHRVLDRELLPVEKRKDSRGLLLLFSFLVVRLDSEGRETGSRFTMKR